MKTIFLSYFFLIFLLIIINFSYEKEFNPIPKRNGQLNDKYRHTEDENNLFFIFFTFRHGARSPLILRHNTDILGGKWNNRGELTKTGRKQHYEIGLKNRKRYGKFISNEYNPKELKIFSTYFNRTINSVQSQLLGLYNNITYSNFSFTEFNNTSAENNYEKEIKTILPPIQLIEYDGKKYKKTFKNHFDCYYLRKQIAKNWNKSNEIIENIVNDFNEEYYDILMREYKYLHKINLTSIRGFDRFCDIYEAVYVDEDNKHILNKIKSHGKNITVIKEKCDNYLYNHYRYIRNGGYALDNGVISQSDILVKIINWMQVRADQNNNFASKYSEPKFVLYSGHDSTLYEMQSCLNKSFNINFENVDFAAEQLIELRKYSNTFYVEIYYNDKLKLNITFEEFKSSIGSILVNDKDVYNICYKTKEDFYLEYEKIVLTGVTITLSLVFLILICKIYYTKNEDIYKVGVVQIE